MPQKRRENLLKNMEVLTTEGVGCFNCAGKCCTFRANSMQITPLEAVEIYQYLVDKNLWNENLKSLLRQTIADFRLDYDIPVRKGLTLRRTYTCPFFADGPLGCSLPKEVKPYGCLGFNPKTSGVLNGENCHSNRQTLIEREEKYAEQEKLAHILLTREYSLDWPKKPIPLALLAVEKAFESAENSLS